MLGFKNKTSKTADAEKDATKKNPKPKRSRFVKLLTIFAVAALVVSVCIPARSAETISHGRNRYDGTGYDTNILSCPGGNPMAYCPVCQNIT